MSAYLKAENLKIRHTAVIKLTVIAPVFVMLLSHLLADSYFLIDNFNWWYSLMMPLSIAIISGIIIEKDGKMGNRAVISLPVDMRKVWLAKVMTGVEMFAVSSLIIFAGSACCLIVSGGKYTNNIELLPALEAIVVLIVVTAWQIPFCMLLSEKVNIFITLIINFSMNFVGILVATTHYWIFFPHAYSSRLMIPVIKVLPNGMIAESASPTFSEGVLSANVLVPGIVISVILFAVLTIASIYIYAGKEAK